MIPRVTIAQADGSTIPDRNANGIIRDGWTRWGKKGNPTVCGRHSWASANALLGVSYKRDGEALLRFYRGGEFGAFGFRVGIFESDHLPIGLNRNELQNGNALRMGIERDRFDRPVAYWIGDRHPGAPRGVESLDKFQRIPAEEIVHLYSATRAGQSRGLPSLEAGLTSLNMLQGYEEAELVAARTGASKMGFIKSGDGDEYSGSEDATYTESEITETLEPGMLEQLGEGQEFQGWDPTHPTTAFGPFVKQMLRRFASVGGASYNSLANDLESVNFSSLRDGKLTERDFWKREQGTMIETVLERVFDQWLPAALLSNELAPLPIQKLEAFAVHRWQGRRWEWVDPAKEATAHKTQLENLTNTVSSILEGEGREVREVFEEIQGERQLAAEYGVEDLLPYKGASAEPAAPPGPPQPLEVDDDEDEDEED